jgi:rhodanese-related sulfurtransferase
MCKTAMIRQAKGHTAGTGKRRFYNAHFSSHFHQGICRMTYLIDNWYWMVTAAASGSVLLWLNLQNGGATSGISPQEAVMLMNRDKAQVIDVCTGDMFSTSHIRGARNMPLDQLVSGVKGLPSNKKIPLVVVCATGTQAGKAVKQLQQMGHEQVQALKGGMRAWREAQLPCENSAT